MRRTSSISAGIALVALVFVVLAMGGVPRWAQAIAALGMAAALAPTIGSRRGFASISPLLAMIGVALALTLLQLAPLPSALRQPLDPAGMTLRDDGAELLGLDAPSTLSLDVPGTLRALGYFSILFAVALVALRMSASSNGRYRVLAGVAGTCGAVAVIVGVHEILGLRELYGFYTPHATPAVIGPLLNENHLGCLLAVGAVCAIGLAFKRTLPVGARVAWIAVVAACGAATLATHSRGAALALGAGTVVALGVLLGQKLAGDPSRGPRARLTASSLPIAVVAACAVVMIIYASASGIEHQFERTTIDEVQHPRTKFAAWRSAAALIEEAPWVGVGRGGFEVSFTRVHPASGVETFSHVENEYVQAVIDFGIPGALLLGAAGLWLAIVAAKRWRDGPLAAGALGALTVVAVQSNVDFGVELLGIAVPITAIAATVAYVPIQTSQLGRTRLATIATMVLLALSAAFLFSSKTISLEEDHARMAEARTLTRRDVMASLTRHPLDYYGYALIAENLIDTHDARAVHVLNHAMLLHPTHPGLHLLAARMLFQLGHVDQAAGEYANALAYSLDRTAVLGELVASFPVARAAAAIPVDLADADDIVRLLEERGRFDVATAWLAHVLENKPNDLRACEALYALSTRHHDLRAAEVAAPSCTQIQPDQHTRLVIAMMLNTRKSYAAALPYLADVEHWDGLIEEKVAGWFAACEAELGLGHFDVAKKCLRRLDVSGLVDGDRRTLLLARIAEVDKARADASDTPPAPPGATSGSAPSRP